MDKNVKYLLWEALQVQRLLDQVISQGLRGYLQ